MFDPVDNREPLELFEQWAEMRRHVLQEKVIVAAEWMMDWRRRDLTQGGQLKAVAVAQVRSDEGLKQGCGHMKGEKQI